MEPSESESRPKRLRGVERSLQIQLGSMGGFDLRPTRCFVWTGDEREGNERVLPLGSAPRSLLIPRRPREIDAGPVHVRTLGNPVVTVALAGIHAVRRLRRAAER
jgi:hypothetical protein